MDPSVRVLTLACASLLACTSYTRDDPPPPRPTPTPTPTPAVDPPPPPVDPPPARCFAARRDLPLPHWPLNSAFDDLNGDHYPDLVINYSLDSRVGVLLADRDGGFHLQAVPEHPLEHEAVGITLGDFDGDEQPDLAVTDFQGTHVRTHRGRGDGTFDPKARSTQVGKYVGGGIARDFNSDGRTDLAVTLWSDVGVLLGRGDGSFAPPTRMPSGQAPGPLLAADLNNDGRTDLATASNDEHHLALFLARSIGLPAAQTGRFHPATRTPCGEGGHALVADDLDHDGELDLAMANIHSNDVCILRGDGRGGLTVGPVLPAGAHPHGMAAADVTGDGLMDLVVAAWAADPKAPAEASRDGAVIVLAGDGNGAFSIHAAVAVGDSPTDIYITDLDQDIHRDVVTVNSNGRSVTLLRGAPCRNQR
jgi:hypothetical protein